jgi:lipoic acid synthetase
MSIETTEKKQFTPKPKWLRVKLPTGKKYTDLRGLVDKYKLNTICTSGSCPNMGECWTEGTATFMILGNICTRSCGFCGVKTGRPETIDWDEPEKVARSIKLMNIKHAVITSVDRDDLKDMGSILWAETVKSIRRMNPNITLETLIPDFQGNTTNIDRILAVQPEVISHNMETVKRLSREVSQTIKDLSKVKLDIITIGQYLQPSKKHLSVKEFITPEQFKKYETIGLELGFRHVESGALVRSSYKAQKHLT